MNQLADLARITLVLAFTAAVIAKRRRPQPLIRRLQLLGVSEGLSTPVAVTIAVMETALAIALAFGVELPLVATASAAMLWIFSLSILARPTAAGCGCGLPGEGLPEWQLLGRNALLASAAALIVWRAAPDDPLNVIFVASVTAALVIASVIAATSRDRTHQSSSAVENVSTEVA